MVRLGWEPSARVGVAEGDAEVLVGDVERPAGLAAQLEAGRDHRVGDLGEFGRDLLVAVPLAPLGVRGALRVAVIDLAGEPLAELLGLPEHAVHVDLVQALLRCWRRPGRCAGA